MPVQADSSYLGPERQGDSSYRGRERQGHSQIWNETPPKTNLLQLLKLTQSTPAPAVRPGEVWSGPVRFIGQVCGFDYYDYDYDDYYYYYNYY